MNKSGVYSDEKLRVLFSVLQDFERKELDFSVQELAQVSGYRVSSLRTYIGKKLKNYLLTPTQKGKYKVTGSLRLDVDAFVRHMSQRSSVIDVEETGIVQRLLRRSVDAFFLSIEIYNRPTQNNRVEVFCILMINAWELLLKAEISVNAGEQALYYKDDPSRTLALRDVIKKVILNEKDPVRRNIEYLADLRDQAIHLLIPELQSHVSRLFQSSVFNYIKRYSVITGKKFSDTLGLGLISLVIDTSDLSTTALKEVYSELTAKEIGEFLERFRRTEAELTSIDFAIPIEYKLAFTKKEDQSDIKVSTGGSGATGVFIEVAKDVDITHPHLQKDAVAKIKAQLTGLHTSSFTTHDFQAVLFKEKMRSSKSNQYYHLIEKPITHRYSEECVRSIVEKINQDTDYLRRCRESYRTHQRKTRRVRGNRGL